MACRYNKQQTAMQSAYCPTCAKRTLHGEQIALAVTQVSEWGELKGLTAAMLCCSSSCLQAYQAKLQAVHSSHTKEEQQLLSRLGSLSLAAAMRLQR
jgi:hypothetical protein